VGVASDHPDPISSEYIYNGARDNAVGTTGVIEAAKYFSQNPPRRSVLLAAWTAEERGLLGSGYFAENPMVPLNQIIYNLNIDGAGYNDTTKVTVIGLGRTEADDDMASAAAAFGLEAIPDPVPEQNLFNRSDNVHFARAGIPAPTYSMGLTAFDDEINYYYHQTTDEPHTLNYEYVTAYIRSFVLAAQNIADRDEAPFWLPGDEYKEAGKELYNR
jgi:Zn-dependent M28 family amino/carboxypeptidase